METCSGLSQRRSSKAPARSAMFASLSCGGMLRAGISATVSFLLRRLSVVLARILCFAAKRRHPTLPPAMKYDTSNDSRHWGVFGHEAIAGAHWIRSEQTRSSRPTLWLLTDIPGSHPIVAEQSEGLPMGPVPSSMDMAPGSRVSEGALPKGCRRAFVQLF